MKNFLREHDSKEMTLNFEGDGRNNQLSGTTAVPNDWTKKMPTCLKKLSCVDALFNSFVFFWNVCFFPLDQAPKAAEAVPTISIDIGPVADESLALPPTATGFPASQHIQYPENQWKSEKLPETRTCVLNSQSFQVMLLFSKISRKKFIRSRLGLQSGANL